MNNFKLIYLIIFSLTLFQTIFAQSENDRINITKDYNTERLEAMSLEFSNDYKFEKQKAIEYARKNNIDIIIDNNDGGIAILQKVLKDGTLIYYSTFNAGSAITINTNEVHEGGSNGLSLTGKDITLGIWDGGIVRESHQELVGRVVQLDNPDFLSGHATHVSGTMIASGVSADARGMSNEAELIAYDFDNDVSEMATEASNGMLVSNHSYGINPNSIPDIWFGAYLSLASNVDAITYNAPYYLPVFAAGNSNGALPPHNAPKNGYDLISGSNLAKNILSVANVEQVDNYVDATSVNIWGNSSWGPTDDGRIKPDISAKGRLTYSSDSDSDNDYSTKTGTSMAAPAVSGSIGLLHEHHNNIYNSFLSASSMKALVIHSAREAGNDPGPDYIYGWGLMNTSAAAELITNKNFTNIIEENTLNEGDTYTFTVNATDPNTPLIATLVWTDPAGLIQDLSVADDPTPRLVNDLDLKIIAPDAFTEFLPWTLSAANPSAAATKADNTVDNVEKVEIENAQGQYTIEVSHKGTLEDLLQNYSLIVSGIAESDFAITTDNAHKIFCGNETATFELDVNSIDSFTGLITLSQSGLPPELNLSFSPSTINNQGESTLSIDNLSAVPFGEYTFTVTATSGALSYSFDFVLNIKEVISLTNVILNAPLNPGALEYLTPILDWDPLPDAISYEVQLSESPNFNNLFFSEIIENTQIETPELNSSTTYYWRVRPLNDCSVGDFSSSLFTTVGADCNPLLFSTDTPINISNSETSTVQSVIPVNSSLGVGNVVDVNVHLELSHTRLSDLIISLTSPDGTIIKLLDQACGDLDDLQVIFDDKGSSQNCDDVNPIALSGIIKPEEKLSLFENEIVVGDWILTVEDLVLNEGGSIDSFGLDICSEVVLSVNSNEFTDFSIYPNPSTGKVELNFGQPKIGEADIHVFDLNGRVQKSYKVLPHNNRKTLDLNDLSSGIYLVKLTTQKSSIVKKLIIK